MLRVASKDRSIKCGDSLEMDDKGEGIKITSNCKSKQLEKNMVSVRAITWVYLLWAIEDE